MKGFVSLKFNSLCIKVTVDGPREPRSKNRFFPGMFGTFGLFPQPFLDPLYLYRDFLQNSSRPDLAPLPLKMTAPPPPPALLGVVPPPRPLLPWTLPPTSHRSSPLSSQEEEEEVGEQKREGEEGEEGEGDEGEGEEERSAFKQVKPTKLKLTGSVTDKEKIVWRPY
jgi:hypothetical protein